MKWDKARSDVPLPSLVAGLADRQVEAMQLSWCRGTARELWPTRWVSPGRPSGAGDKLPQFKLHLERLRYELHAARVDRIWALMDKAYDVVEENLDEGDPQVALRLLGLAGGRLTDPGEDGRPQD